MYERIVNIVMTLFLAMLLSAMASHQQQHTLSSSLKQKLERHLLEQILNPIDNQLITSTMHHHPQKQTIDDEDSIYSKDKNHNNGCSMTFLRENMNTQLLKESVAALLDKGMTREDILKAVIHTIDAFPVIAQHPSSRKTEGVTEPDDSDRVKYNTRSGGFFPFEDEDEDELHHQSQYVPHSVVLQVDGSRPNEIHKIAIDIMPFMGVNDVFQQGYLEFLYRHPDIVDNPFEIDIMKVEDCYKVVSIADVTTIEPNYWLIQVYNDADKMIYSGKCIPRKSDVAIRPGYSVKVVLVQPSFNVIKKL